MAIHSLLLCNITHLNHIFIVMYGNIYSFTVCSDNDQMVKNVLLSLGVCVLKKIKFNLEQGMKVHRGKCIALLFL